MTDNEERAYLQGQRSAAMAFLSTVFYHLGYDSPEAQAVKWIAEREAAIATLRRVCAEYGDNDWTEQLHLADIIEKHLARHLE